MNQFHKLQAEKIKACYETLEKGGKRASIGETRVWSEQKYIKQAAGWVLVNEEAKSNLESVYHFTTPSSLLKIWESNELKTGRDGKISFTSDTELWSFRDQHEHETEDIGVKIEFDSSKLPKLEAYDDSSYGADLSDEKEFVSTNKIDNIKDKIKTVIVDSYYKDRVKDWPKDLQDKTKII